MIIVMIFYCFLKKKVMLIEDLNSEDFIPNVGEIFLKAGLIG